MPKICRVGDSGHEQFHRRVARSERSAVGLDDDTPRSEEEIGKLREEIDHLDAEILAAIKRRTEVSQIIGRTRMASGGTRLVHAAR